MGYEDSSEGDEDPEEWVPRLDVLGSVFKLHRTEGRATVGFVYAKHRLEHEQSLASGHDWYGFRSDPQSRSGSCALL